MNVIDAIFCFLVRRGWGWWVVATVGGGPVRGSENCTDSLEHTFDPQETISRAIPSPQNEKRKPRGANGGGSRNRLERLRWMHYNHNANETKGFSDRPS